MDREAWKATAHLGPQRVGYNLATKQQVSRKPSITFLKILPAFAIAQYQGHIQL